MPTTNHLSGLPEQEPTSPAAVVLCGDESWVNTDVGWESRTQWLGAWGDLRVFAAERGGATLFDLADLPTGLTEAQKGAVRSIESKFLTRGGIATDIRNALPEAFADDLVTAKYSSGDPEEVRDELLRVAEMEGAHAVAKGRGVTHAGSVEVRRGTTGCPFLTLGNETDSYHVLFSRPGWTITVTAPKPADQTGGDPVVLALVADEIKKRVIFRAEDGTWAAFRGSDQGAWITSDLAEIERLSPQAIAELMGGEQA